MYFLYISTKKLLRVFTTLVCETYASANKSLTRGTDEDHKKICNTVLVAALIAPILSCKAEEEKTAYQQNVERSMKINKNMNAFRKLLNQKR